MAGWLVLLMFSAVAGALLLYHRFSKTKEASERLIDEYAKLLAEARQRMVAEQEGDDSTPEA